MTLETGASHAPTFSKNTTHLLCPSRQGPKAEKALEWGIPVVDMIWLDGLLMTTSSSPMTEDGANTMQPRSEDGEGGVVKPEPAPEPVLECMFFSSPSLPLTKSVEVDAENSGGTESSPQETFPPADNSILPEFEFRTNDFLARSTPRKGQLLKPEPTLGGEAESSSLQLPSAVTHLEDWEPVPSSRSPSPMVLKKSPSKEEEREQRAHQVIAESITTLLGKRQASKEEVVTTAQNGRVAKRSRPMSRTKVGKSSSLPGVEFTTRFQSLNKEKERAVEETEGDTFVFGTPKNGVIFRPVLLEPGVEGENDGFTVDPPKDDDARVTYEDPRQREEKQRLVSILGGKEGVAPKPRGKRRSTRLAGF